ncbi:class I SAM-dependent methyltransferase [Phenylobacterium aquaticum]|uniref:class I SAM-dependent methyltransferase n=2 Tax=Phenylobacterium aquaticum TaxID=1763816 RepID=UPI0026EA87FF|nr:class I SAM-dependent methyltransferase [Phenylobacterium aquaticum]
MSGAILYGAPAPGLTDIPPGATQVSPLIPGSADLAAMADGSADEAVILAPPGVLERDFVLAHALRVLKPHAALTVLAPKDKGGSRLKKALERFGCVVGEDARRHHRFCYVERPEAPASLAEVMAAGGPRLVAALGLWSQPGVFSWDRIDPGTARLMEHLPALKGRGADLGCGIGILATHILAQGQIESLVAIDIDRRAVECARHNLDDPRVLVRWADVRRLEGEIAGLDFVVMNPPFHDGGAEDRALGSAFIRAAGAMLGKGGTCWLVANRHLPYEATLNETFAKVTPKVEVGGFKVYEARK